MTRQQQLQKQQKNLRIFNSTIKFCIFIAEYIYGILLKRIFTHQGHEVSLYFVTHLYISSWTVLITVSCELYDIRVCREKDGFLRKMDVVRCLSTRRNALKGKLTTKKSSITLQQTDLCLVDIHTLGQTPGTCMMFY